MSILESIRAASLSARKAKLRSAALLVTLLSEASMVGRNQNRESTDAEVIAVVKKFMKNNDETMSRASQDLLEQLEQENAVLSQFLPKQMTAEEIISKMQLLVTERGYTAVGPLLKEFKQLYAGNYDGAQAAAVAREVLQ